MNLFTKGNRITDVEKKPMVTKEELGEGINEKELTYMHFNI